MMMSELSAWFFSLVGSAPGQSAVGWQQTLARIEPQLWAKGLGQQRDSSGTPRARLFLPHAACPNAAPDPGVQPDCALGVRQRPACWETVVDVVDDATQTWAWIERGGPAYQPYQPAEVPPDTPAPDPELIRRVAALEQACAQLAKEAAELAQNQTTTAAAAQAAVETSGVASGVANALADRLALGVSTDKIWGHTHILRIPK